MEIYKGATNCANEIFQIYFKRQKSKYFNCKIIGSDSNFIFLNIQTFGF